MFHDPKTFLIAAVDKKNPEHMCRVTYNRKMKKRDKLTKKIYKTTLYL